MNKSLTRMSVLFFVLMALLISCSPAESISGTFNSAGSGDHYFNYNSQTCGGTAIVTKVDNNHVNIQMYGPCGSPATVQNVVIYESGGTIILGTYNATSTTAGVILQLDGYYNPSAKRIGLTFTTCQGGASTSYDAFIGLK